MEEIQTSLKLKQICSIENIDMKKMNQYVKNIGKNKSDETKNPDEVLLSLVYKTFLRLSAMEKEICQYNDKAIEYNELNTLYNKNNDLATTINRHNAGTTSKAKKQKQGKDLMSQIFTTFGIKRELLKYELMYYALSEKVTITKNNYDLIKNLLDHFNPIIESYTEDKEWTINYQNNKNFVVPVGKVIYSNTIEDCDADNTIILSHLDLIVLYIKRNYQIQKVKYVIHEDNRQHFHWILLSIQ